MENNLHIGGREPKAGWKILNIQAAPGVDFVGDISNLSQFDDQTFDRIYASHVLEHVPQSKMLATLAGIFRVLWGGWGVYGVGAKSGDFVASHSQPDGFG